MVRGTRDLRFASSNQSFLSSTQNDRSFIDYQWDADTAVMKSFSKENDGYADFVVTIDVFSGYANTYPLRSTQGKEMVTALQTIFRLGRRPTKLRTDKGVEFRNKDVQRLLKAENVDYFYTQKDVSKRYKSRLFRYLSCHQTHRWIDVLDEITQSYNASFHRSIKMAPRAVTKRDETRLWKMQYTRQYKAPTQRYAFKKGDTVRISHVRQPFDREYDERWMMKYFVVDDRDMKEGIPYYTLKDTTGDDVQGTFHQSEMNRVQVNDGTVNRVGIASSSKRSLGEMDGMA
ncbi:unnamed protein product [Mytilus coruscus]|uniref:Integrase catalytic domain-containing protein n=1 Tax=Mytilus coruscus TaxID=42192 RepID=A0A6J8DW62_MYTCO|nr:unnamed protein product [Mytilus coruscus]